MVDANIAHTFSDGFENFFNNESLSDRILCICEVEEVEYYMLQSGTKRKCISDNADEFFKRIKQEDVKEVPAGVISVGEDNIEAKNNTFCSPQTAALIPHIKIEEESETEVETLVKDLPEEQDKKLDTGHTPVDYLPSDTENRSSNIHNPKIDNSNEYVDLSVYLGDGPLNNDRNSVNNDNTEVIPHHSTEQIQATQSQNKNDACDDSEMTGEIYKNHTGDLPTVPATEESPSEEQQLEVPVEIEVTGNSHDDPQEPVVKCRTYTKQKNVLKESKVFVHSIILVAKSDFFKCLFSSGMKETEEKEVKVEVGKGETDIMLIMLRCFYNRDFITQHSLDDVIKVMSLAMRYCFDGLIDKCLDVFATRTESITTIEDFNRINIMVAKIQNDLSQHKDKCSLVTEKCGPFLVKHFRPLDESLEEEPSKFYKLRLEAMNLFLDSTVQKCFESKHGNLLMYAIQRWVHAHVAILADLNDFSRQYKLDIIAFIEKFLNTVDMTDISSDFLTNVLNYEISPFNIWSGYQEWYIKSLQNHVHKLTDRRTVFHNHASTYEQLSRKRSIVCTRQERNADVFSINPSVILNGFEIGIYLRVREDRKVYMLCKCKNLKSNKVGFDKASLAFALKGVLKLNNNSNIWKESFPRQMTDCASFAQQDRLMFSYKQNTMCLQMYALCKLSPAVYDIGKRNGFYMEFVIHQLSG